MNRPEAIGASAPTTTTAPEAVTGATPVDLLGKDFLAVRAGVPLDDAMEALDSLLGTAARGYRRNCV